MTCITPDRSLPHSRFGSQKNRTPLYRTGLGKPAKWVCCERESHRKMED